MAICFCSITYSQQPLNVDIVFENDPFCYGDSTGSATANASGGVFPYQFEWDDPNNSTDNIVNDLPAGTWTVTVTDDVGNTATESVTLEDPDELIVSMSSVPTSGCAACDGEATASGQGGTGNLNYEWNNGQNTQTITNLCVDLYTVTVTDQNMCTVVDSIEVSSSGGSGLTLDLSSTASECNDSTGTASVQVSGGLAPYSYLWDDYDSQETQTAEDLPSGTYTVQVEDDNGCVETGTVTVNNFDGPDISINIDDVSCNGFNDGSLEAILNGGQEPYSYQWDDSQNQTTQVASDLSAGIYTVIVTDDNGCSSSDEATVVEPDEIDLTGSSVNSTCGQSDGEASVVASGGTGGYTYLWDDPNNQTTSTATGLSSGNYTVIVTDDSNCSNSIAVSVSDENAPELTVDKTIPSCGDICDGEISVIATGGTSPYDFQWGENADSSDVSDISQLCSGEYSVVVTDDLGCSVATSIALDEPQPINVNISVFDNTITADNTNGDSYYLFDCDIEEVVDTSLDNSFSVDATGTYAIIIKEDLCEDTSECKPIDYTSLDEYNNIDDLVKVYPNPAVENLFVKVENAEFLNLKLFSINGKLKYQNSNLSSEVTKINVANLENGLYILRIHSNKGIVNKKVSIK